jgi:single-strand DNA-binding protein
VATNENYQDKSGEWQTQTEWHNIVCWRSLAERVEKTLKKGNLVYLEGKLTTRKWQDKDGSDRYTTEVVARTVKQLERRDASLSDGMGHDFPGGEDEFPTVGKRSDEAMKTMDNEDDDLPF